MKHKFAISLFTCLVSVGSVSAQGFYQFGTDQGEGTPLKWRLGFNTIYDDNVAAGRAAGEEDSSFALNPSVGASLTQVTPQSTIDIYGQLGAIYYFDAPEGLDDFYSQSRLGLNFIHRFSERLRFSSTNFTSYELEPDYAYGYATSRTGGETLYMETDDSIGFRLTERLGTYAGIRVKSSQYDESDNDRLIWQLYNQLRYQMTPQTVLTFDYRYGQTDASGVANDSENHYLLLGSEHRFSSQTVGVIRAGAQFRDVETRDNSTSPFVEFNLNSRLSQSFSLRSFLRYGVEDFDTIQLFDRSDDAVATLFPAEYADRRTLRFGVNAEYMINPMFSIVGGLDYMPTRYRDGAYISDGVAAPDVDEDIINASLGLRYRLSDFITASLSYNFSSSDSDFVVRDYDRNRISLGVSAEF
ncbi:MAG: hypothetical protein ACO3JG_03815 [Luteolibacter sp.]